MRIFYAIDFDEKTKREISYIAKYVADYLKAGRMIDPFNYHITLKYIGEIDEGVLGEYIKVLREAALYNVRKELILRSISSFTKDKRHLIYLKAENNNEVERIRADILKATGSKERSYLPHVTLFRDVIFKEGFSIDTISDIIDFKEIKYIVNEISLMESKTINGKIVYIILYDQSVKGADNGS